MPTVLLLRHGRTTANAAGGLAGRQPVELDDTGRAQARQVGERLRPLPLSAVVSSPLIRCRQTLQLADVLMLGGEGEPKVGVPTLSGASVAATVLEQKKGEKVLIFKKRRRHNSRRKNGHRQELTVLRIGDITAG